MREEKNRIIRDECKRHDIYLWQLAAALGISPQTLSVRLRNELPATEQLKIVEVIQEMKNAEN